VVIHDGAHDVELTTEPQPELAFGGASKSER
jgi:hypothetical protein